ncbi:MAG: NAD-glutamate dehydrogenase domain-containing protein [Lentisphaeria bacterium]
MTGKKLLITSIEKEQRTKLNDCYLLLEKIMPPYFFKNFNERDLSDVFSLMVDIQEKKGIQMIERSDSILLVYLKSEESNPLITARMMAGCRILRVLIHESKPIPEFNKVLVIEQIIKYCANKKPVAAIFSLESLQKGYRELFGEVPEGFTDLYHRLNWGELEDLDLSRIIQRLHLIFNLQNEEYSLCLFEKLAGMEYRLSVVCPTIARQEGYYAQILETLKRNHFSCDRAYLRDFTKAGRPDDFTKKEIRFNTFYITYDLDSKDIEKKLDELKWELNELCWSPVRDVFEQELVVKHGFSNRTVNLLRASAEFIHTQLSFFDRNAFTLPDIYRFMATHPPILANIALYFEHRFSPALRKHPVRLDVLKTLEHSIDEIDSGMQEKDERMKVIFRAVLNFVYNIRKSNYYCAHKSALAFRLDPGFMKFYEGLSKSYALAFPPERPYGVFFFYRRNAVGFHVRFSDIARGGWRTVLPRSSSNVLESNDSYNQAHCELFRECFVLANTQHKKNKDIYEGGSKLVTLLKTTAIDFKPELWSAQRAIFDAFLSLIHYDQQNKLCDKSIVDLLKKKEIIEIGPDENMFDEMIAWMGARAAEKGYTLGAGIISGKPENGMNHKHYGVTSFGVHQYLLRMLKYLKIDPEKDDFSIKISGGPFGDVAGNEMKILNAKNASGEFLMPKLRIVAITDGPAAVYDPAGLDREELSRLIHQKNLDEFDYKKLKGDGASMIFSKAIVENNDEFHRAYVVEKGTLQEKKLSGDEFMRLFQTNICHYADVFMPCGGRPQTLNRSNYKNYLPGGKLSSRAIVEGANSFIAPEVRIELQKLGLPIIKDASANKCGVITSSYEILSGLMLSVDEFKSVKEELVAEVMSKLKEHANREAEWLLSEYQRTGTFLTVLTDSLSDKINCKNEKIKAYLDKKPELITDALILEHLPAIFKRLFPERVKRIPPEYRRAIAGVELAIRICYKPSDPIEKEIEEARTLK